MAARVPLGGWRAAAASEEEALATFGPDRSMTRLRGASNEKAKRELNFSLAP
jgi:hypothetical protein